MNAEGYKDPTAEQAIRKYNAMPHHIKTVWNALNRVAGLHGLEITGLRDRKTGREYDLGQRKTETVQGVETGNHSS